MEFVPVVVVPFVALAFVLAKRRLGPEAAGLVGALPFTLPLILVGTAVAGGDAAASVLGFSTAAHVPIQVTFAVVFAAGARRWGAAAGLAVGVAVFAALSVLLAWSDLAVGVALALPALVAALRWMPRPRPLAETRDGSMRTLVLTCMTATIVVASALVVVRIAGPVAGGVVAAFPTLSVTLTVLLIQREGREAGAAALGGFVDGMAGYFAFCLTVGLAAPIAGTPAALAAGMTLSIVALLVTVTYRKAGDEARIAALPVGLTATHPSQGSGPPDAARRHAE